MGKKIALSLFALLSGALTAAAVLSPHLWRIIFIAPALFLTFLLVAQNFSKRSVFFLSALSGFGTSLVAFLPFLSTYPLSWAGIPPSAFSLGLVIALWLLLSLAAGLPWGLWGLGVYLLRERIPRSFLVAAAVSLWVGAEYASTFLLSLFFAGEPAPLSFDFRMIAVGYILAESDAFRPLAALGGLSLLSAFAIAPGVIIAEALSQWIRRRKLFVLLPSFLILAAYAAAAFPPSAFPRKGGEPPFVLQKEMRVVVARTDFPSTLVLSEEERARRGGEIALSLATIQKSSFSPDLVVFGEGVAPEDYFERPEEEFSRYLPAQTLVVASGKRSTLTGDTILQTLEYRGGALAGRADKKLLMPFGEYVPYFFQAMGGLINPTLLKNLRTHRTYAAGKETSLFADANGVFVGARRCSEVFSPRLYRELKERGSGILLTLSSAAIFHESPLFTQVVRSVARIRGAENKAPAVVAFNGGDPAAFDCRGREILPQRRENNLFFFTIPSSAFCAQ